MKKAIIFLMLAGLLPFAAQAQLSKLMYKLHGKNGTTVTQLDRSLYGLYQKDNLSPEAAELLQKLDEVNLLNLDINKCDVKLADKVISQFQEILNNPEKYKLIKSHNDGNARQMVYTSGKDGKVSDLVVWDQNPQGLEIIELRGDICLDKVALLSRALNLKGINSLAALSAEEERDTYGSFRSLGEDLSRQMDILKERMRNYYALGSGVEERQGDSIQPGRRGDLFGSFDFFEDFFGSFGERSGFPEIDDMIPEEMKKMFGEEGMQESVKRFYQSFGDGENVISNSVEITEENGKTKLKIDAKNSEMTYIIDGKEAPKENLQMPGKIMNVNIIPSKEDMKKSYLFVTSGDKVGDFKNFREGVLTFTYENQEYRFNLDKARNPLLVIDGRLSVSFDIDPADILQIRPLSQLEKEVGYYPEAGVVINTK